MGKMKKSFDDVLWVNERIRETFDEMEEGLVSLMKSATQDEAFSARVRVLSRIEVLRQLMEFRSQATLPAEFTQHELPF